MCGKTGNDKGSVSNGRELTRLSLKGTKTRPFFPGYDRSALHEMRMEMLLQAFLGGWLDGQGGMKTPSSTGRKRHARICSQPRRAEIESCTHLGECLGSVLSGN
jgi:hypothetical protein